MNDLKFDSEEIALIDNVFYLHAPNGIGRSNLAARVGRLLGVGATARNWRAGSLDITNAPNRLRLEHARQQISP